MSCVVLISEHVINERTSFRSQRFFALLNVVFLFGWRMRQKAHCGVRRHLACDDDLRVLQTRRRLGSLRTLLSSLTIDQSSITLTHNLLHDILADGHAVTVELCADFHYLSSVGRVGKGRRTVTSGCRLLLTLEPKKPVELFATFR